MTTTQVPTVWCIDGLTVVMGAMTEDCGRTFAVSVQGYPRPKFYLKSDVFDTRDEAITVALRRMHSRLRNRQKKIAKLGEEARQLEYHIDVLEARHAVAMTAPSGRSA